MFDYILVPLDESSRAEQAIPVAARIAHASSGSLRLLHVMGGPVQYARQYGGAALISTDIVEADRRRAETYLHQIASWEELRDVQVATEVLIGDPARAILDVSQANLLVLCTHGYTGITSWLLGSVASKLAHRSNVPILFLHPEVEQLRTDTHANQSQTRVLVPLDGSLLAEEAIEPAATLSRLLSTSGQAALHLASVLPINELGWPPAKRELTIEQAQTYLTRVEQRLLQKRDGSQQPSITTSVTVSLDVASALIELAASGKGVVQASGPTECAIIAIATHGRGAFARWVMGSTAERILHTTKLPVLLLRPHQMNVHSDKEQHNTEHKKAPGR